MMRQWKDCGKSYGTRKWGLIKGNQTDSRRSETGNCNRRESK